jgi:hypothetical protein
MHLGAYLDYDILKGYLGDYLEIHIRTYIGYEIPKGYFGSYIELLHSV